MITEPAPATASPSSSLDRRAIATIAAVVVLAVGAGVVAATVLMGGRGAGSLGTAASYVPADSVMYFEARLDLPGAQRQNLRAILDRFPALEPDDYLTDALADTLDDLLGDAGAPLDYSNDVAPWFDGRMSLAMLDYPLNANPMNMQVPSMLFAFGVRDAAGAASFTEALRAEMEAGGVDFTSAQHRGTTVWELDLDPSMMGMVSGVGFAHAVTDDQLLLSFTADTLTQALDVRAGEGDSLANRAEVRQLSASLPSEVAGVMTMDLAAMLAEMQAELEAVDPELAQALDGYLDNVPPFAMSTVRFEPDALVMDGVSNVPDGPLAPVNGDRGLADRVPADAIFFADGTNLGAALEQALTAMKAGLAVGPAGEQQLAELDKVEAALGASLEEFVEWIGAGSMAAGWDGSEPWFGFVLEADDPDAAAQRLDQLAALAELATMDASVPLEVTTETVDGADVTTLRMDTSGGTDAAPLSEVVVQWTMDGDHALIGIGDFVLPALGLEQSGSLAESARFGAALERFGSGDNAGAFFLDLAALREAIVLSLPPDMRAAYSFEIASNLEPLDMLAGLSRVDGDVLESTFSLILR